MSNDRNSENIFLEGFKQVFLCQKRSRLSCLKEQDLKNKRKRKNEKKEIAQKKFYKKG